MAYFLQLWARNRAYSSRGLCEEYTWYLKQRLNSTVSCCCHQTLHEGSLFVHGTQSRGVERVRECFLSILRLGALFLCPLFLALGTVSDCKRVVSLGFLANIPSSVLQGQEDVQPISAFPPNRMASCKTNKQANHFICLNGQKGGNTEEKQTLGWGESQNTGWGEGSVN